MTSGDGDGNVDHWGCGEGDAGVGADAGRATGNAGVGADVMVDRGVGRASVGWDCMGLCPVQAEADA